MADQFVVNVMGLNLREQPSSASSMNILARINEGDRCEHLPSDKDTSKWIRIRMDIDDSEVIGYVAKRFLDKIDGNPATPIKASELTIVNMKENKSNITRSNRLGRAFPIGESTRPKRNKSSKAARATSLHKIVDWLDVEKSDRYEPETTKTFCNIYAYDYCYLAGVFIPRVWWMSSAIADLVRNRTVDVKYGVTIREMNVNSIHDWLEEYGGAFGWKRKFSLDDIQKDANDGKVVVITAQQIDLNRSGHIVAVVPETDSLKAVRFDDNSLKFPLQSQAGRTNRKFFTDVNNGKWWTRSNYRDFGFWVHD